MWHNIDTTEPLGLILTGWFFLFRAKEDVNTKRSTIRVYRVYFFEKLRTRSIFPTPPTIVVMGADTTVILLWNNLIKPVSAPFQGVPWYLVSPTVYTRYWCVRITAESCIYIYKYVIYYFVIYYFLCLICYLRSTKYILFIIYYLLCISGVFNVYLWLFFGGWGRIRIWHISRVYVWRPQVQQVVEVFGFCFWENKNQNFRGARESRGVGDGDGDGAHLNRLRMDIIYMDVFYRTKLESRKTQQETKSFFAALSAAL